MRELAAIEMVSGSAKEGLIFGKTLFKCKIQKCKLPDQNFAYLALVLLLKVNRFETDGELNCFLECINK